MKSICLIVPYFGNLPDNFQIWLNSCRYNTTINWLIFTDDKRQFYYPSNVEVIYMSFEELCKNIQSLYDFKISIDNPYKLCDYRVAYGELFEKYIAEYDFWGYCDIDLVFGNIRNFITDSILEKYDKILSRGHFTLFRNNKIINTIYRKNINGKIKYKEVFSSKVNLSFDEWSKDGINYLFINSGIPIYDEIIFSDIYIGKYAFYPYQLMNKEKYKKYNCYLWDKGRLFRYFYDANQEKLCKEEVMYIHLQKRRMLIENNITSKSSRILIIPNKYMEYMDQLDEKTIKKLGKDKLLYWDFILYRFNNLRRKLFKVIN